MIGFMDRFGQLEMFDIFNLPSQQMRDIDKIFYQKVGPSSARKICRKQNKWKRFNQVEITRMGRYDFVSFVTNMEYKI